MKALVSAYEWLVRRKAITAALLLLGLLSFSKIVTDPLRDLGLGLFRRALGEIEFGAFVLALVIFWLAAARYAATTTIAAVKSEFAKGHGIRPLVFVPPALVTLLLAYVTWGIVLVFSPMFTIGNADLTAQFMFWCVLACVAFVVLLAVAATVIEWLLKRIKIEVRLVRDADALAEQDAASQRTADTK